MSGIALEVQRPFSHMILTGLKTIETRNYELPSDLIGVPIILLESNPPPTGTTQTISSLPDVISETNAESFGLVFLGSVIFTSCFEYTDKDAWENDRDKHKVPLGSPFDYNPNPNPNPSSGVRKFGWVVDVSKTVVFTPKDAETRVAGLARKFRSIFEITR